MAEISSTKVQSPIYAEKVYSQISIATTYSITGAWANATGWTLTIPETGSYNIVAEGVIQLDDLDMGTDVPARLRFAVGGVAEPDTVRYFRPRMIAGQGSEMSFSFSKIMNLVAGQVITLQALKSNAGDGVAIYGTVTYGNRFSYELLQQTVSVRDISEDYSTSEVDTGRLWIDGKRIYRRVYTGTTAAAATSTLALGFTIDSLVSGDIIVDSSSYGWNSSVSNIGNGPSFYFTTTAQDELTLYHNVAHLQSRSYRVWLEYTK